MQASAIRHLAVSNDAAIIAAACFEKTVQIWSGQTGQQIGEFNTLLDFGGQRLALTPDGTTCIAGAWGKLGRGPRGLAAYSVPDGKLLWNRHEIRHIQYVSILDAGRKIFCGTDNTAAQIIETATGNMIEKIKAARKLWESPNETHQLLVKKGPRYYVRGQNKFEIRPLSFALHGAAFSPEAVCISEPRDGLHPDNTIGGTSLIDLATGELRRHLDINPAPLAYNQSDGKFYGVTLSRSSPRQRTLVCFGNALETHEDVASLGACWVQAISPAGNLLVTNEGGIYATSTGELRMRLDFPSCDYPDR